MNAGFARTKSQQVKPAIHYHNGMHQLIPWGIYTDFYQQTTTNGVDLTTIVARHVIGVAGA